MASKKTQNPHSFIRTAKTSFQVSQKHQHCHAREELDHKPNSTITKTFVLPQPPSSSNNDDHAKENQNLIVRQDRIVEFSYPRKVSSTTNAAAPVAAVIRRLSMPALVKGKDEDLGKCVSRIMVFLRVRPKNKKKIELGSRCCVRIVNQQRNRVKGRHFAFDGSFTDSATQLQVYSPNQKVYVRGGQKEEEPLEMTVYNQGMFKTEPCNKWQDFEVQLA